MINTALQSPTPNNQARPYFMYLMIVVFSSLVAAILTAVVAFSLSDISPLLLYFYAPHSEGVTGGGEKAFLQLAQTFMLVQIVLTPIITVLGLVIKRTWIDKSLKKYIKVGISVGLISVLPHVIYFGYDTIAGIIRFAQSAWAAELTGYGMAIVGFLGGAAFWISLHLLFALVFIATSMFISAIAYTLNIDWL